MIVDCFPFFEEFDVLELRMRTLEDVVDRWVIIESPFTFRGGPKPMYLHERPELIAKWRDRITLLAYDVPPGNHSWENERRQRDAIKDGLLDCAPDDLILSSDLDEIPDPALVGTRPWSHKIVGHRMMNADGYLNRFARGGERCRLGTRAFVYRDLDEIGPIGNLRHLPFDDFDMIDSGWHFTSLGGAAVLERKIGAYSHEELDIPYFRDPARLAMNFASTEDTWMPIDERFPKPLLDDPERWAQYVWSQHDAIEIKRAGALQHAHGTLAYAPADAQSVAVLSGNPSSWEDAGRERFGAAFTGVFASLDALCAAIPERAWVIVDGLEQKPRRTLHDLCAKRAHIVSFSRNARSFERFRSALGAGMEAPRYPGRALGRAEYTAEIAAAGLTIARMDRVRSVHFYVEPPLTEISKNVAIEMFAFPELSKDAMYDFITDAFIFTLEPAAGESKPASG